MSYYKSEFPDYDDKLKIPEGFKDNSWHNDVCPHIEKRFYDTKECYVVCLIWQDYCNPELREMEYAKRYLFQIEVNNETIMEKETDDWEVIEQLVKMLA